MMTINIYSNKMPNTNYCSSYINSRILSKQIVVIKLIIITYFCEILSAGFLLVVEHFLVWYKYFYMSKRSECFF